MVIKIHFDGESRKRLIVLGRDIAFWDPDSPSAEFYEADYTAGY